MLITRRKAHEELRRLGAEYAALSANNPHFNHSLLNEVMIREIKLNWFPHQPFVRNFASYMKKEGITK